MARSTVADSYFQLDLRKIIPLLAILASFLIAFVLFEVRSLFVFAGVSLFVAGIMMLFWPELATLFISFVIYANIPVLAARFHGVPAFLAASLILLLLIPLIDYLFKSKKGIRIDETFRFMLLLLGVLILSSVFAKDFATAVEHIFIFLSEGLILYFLMLNVVRRLPTLERVLWVLILTGGLLSTLGIYKSLTGSESQFGGLAQSHLSRAVEISEHEFEDENAHRMDGPVGETNRFAQILLVLLPFAFYKFGTEKAFWMKGLAALIGILILGGISLTYSRGAFLTLSILALLAVFTGHLSPKALVSFGTVLLLLALIVAPGLIGRIASISSLQNLFSDEAHTVDSSFRGRSTEMIAALNAFLDHPVLGVGPGNYAPFYSQYYHINNDFALKYIPKPRRAHNLFLEFAAESGLVGLTVLLSLLALLLYRLWMERIRWIRAGEMRHAALATAAAFSILAYLGTGMFLHLAYQRYLWFVLAVCGSCLYILYRVQPLEAVDGIEADLNRKEEFV